MKRIVCIFLAFALIFVICISSNPTHNSLAAKTEFNYLVCGLDDAAMNSDVMIVINLNMVTNSLSFIQLPRDTLYHFSENVHKINGIFPYLKEKYQDDHKAFDKLKNVMSDLLGINIDGFMGFRIDVLRDIFECIGGLDVDFPFDVVTSYKTYLRGINHLEADEAIRLIRHRDGFALADIARVDIQKILISSLITSVKHKIGILTIAKIIGNNYKRLITDLNLHDFLNISFSHKMKSAHFKISYCTLPGKVAFLNDMWYYCMCRKGISEMLDSLSIEHRPVSKLNSSILHGDAYRIYIYDNIEPRIYTKDNFSDLQVRIK